LTSAKNGYLVQSPHDSPPSSSTPNCRRRGHRVKGDQNVTDPLSGLIPTRVMWNVSARSGRPPSSLIPSSIAIPLAVLQPSQTSLLRPDTIGRRLLSGPFASHLFSRVDWSFSCRSRSPRAFSTIPSRPGLEPACWSESFLLFHSSRAQTLDFSCLFRITTLLLFCLSVKHSLFYLCGVVKPIGLPLFCLRRPALSAFSCRFPLCRR